MSVTNISSDFDSVDMFNGSEAAEFSGTSLHGSNNQSLMVMILDPNADNFLGFWLLGILGSFIIIMGIFGNICSVGVLSHKQMKSSPNFILIALAVSDLLLIVTSLLMFGLTSIYPYSGMMKDYFYKYEPIIATVAYPIGTIGKKLLMLD